MQTQITDTGTKSRIEVQKIVHGAACVDKTKTSPNADNNQKLKITNMDKTNQRRLIDNYRD